MNRIDGLTGTALAATTGIISLAPSMALGFNGHLGKAAILGTASALLLVAASVGWRKYHRSTPGLLLGMFVPR